MKASGIAWSLDALLAGWIALGTAFLLFSSATQLAIDREQAIQQSALELKSMLWADAIVKNHSAENPLFGAAHYSAEKKRVESHWVEQKLLEKATDENHGSYFVSKLSLKGREKETIFLQRAPSDACVAWNRFVMVWETAEKALLHVVVCVER